VTVTTARPKHLPDVAWPTHPAIRQFRRPWKHVKWAVQYYALVRPALELIRRLRFEASVGLGTSLAGAAYHVVRRDARRARANLTRAFPELSVGEVDVLARESFRHLGCAFGEWVHSSTWEPERLTQLIALEGAEHILRAREQGRGAMLLGAHYDNWEWGGAAIGLRIPSFAAVAKSVYDPRLDRLVREWRARAGVATIDARNTRGLLRHLHEGGALGVLADQSMKEVVHAMVPWFGSPAPTPVGQLRLAAKTGAVVMTGFLHRRGDSRVMVVEPLADHVRLGEEPQVMMAYNRRLEALVRTRPALWPWLHDRWKPRALVTEVAPLL